MPSKSLVLSALRSLWLFLSWPVWFPIALVAIVLSYRQLPMNPRDGLSLARYALESSTHPPPRGFRYDEPFQLALHQLMLYARPDGGFDVWGAHAMGPRLEDKPPPRPNADAYMYLLAYRERRGLWAITTERSGVRTAGMGWLRGNAPFTQEQSATALLAAETYYQTFNTQTESFIARHLAANRTGLGADIRIFRSGYAHTSGIGLCFILLACSFPRAINWLPSHLRRRAAARRGKCIHCRYDVTGVPGLTCPECGRPHGVQPSRSPETP